MTKQFLAGSEPHAVRHLPFVRESRRVGKCVRVPSPPQIFYVGWGLSDFDNLARGNVVSKTLANALDMVPQKDKLVIGSRVIIANEADLRGEISIGSGTVIHPKATILALQGPISIGSDCIIEEMAVIVNRTGEIVKIGDGNLFSVGSRIEAFSIGSHNIFEARSKVASSIGISDFCTIGAGCSVYPKPIQAQQLDSLFSEDSDADLDQEQPVMTSLDGAAAVVREELPNRTVVYGSGNRRRLWSGEGVQQIAALHAKHLEYLAAAIPQEHKLKIVQGVRAGLT